MRQQHNVIMRLACLASVLALASAGCATSSSTGAGEVRDAIQRFHPGATDISCAQPNGMTYECTAILHGKQVTYTASATSDGVLLNSTLGHRP